MKRLLQYFLQGLLYMVPTAATVWLLIWAVNLTDSIVDKLDIFQMLTFPGRGIAILLCFITFMGWLLPKLITRPIADWILGVINRIPLVRLIYGSVRDLMDAFVGKQKRFTSPVLVCLDNTGVQHRLGFVTSRNLTELDIPNNMVAVYLPTSYGMFGDLMILPASKVTPLKTSSTDLMKFVVSGGVIGNQN